MPDPQSRHCPDFVAAHESGSGPSRHFAASSISVAFGARRTLSRTDIAKLECRLAETITQWAAVREFIAMMKDLERRAGDVLRKRRLSDVPQDVAHFPQRRHHLRSTFLSGHIQLQFLAISSATFLKLCGKTHDEISTSPNSLFDTRRISTHASTRLNSSPRCRR